MTKKILPEKLPKKATAKKTVRISGKSKATHVPWPALFSGASRTRNLPDAGRDSALLILGERSNLLTLNLVVIAKTRPGNDSQRRDLERKVAEITQRILGINDQVNALLHGVAFVKPSDKAIQDVRALTARVEQLNNQQQTVTDAIAIANSSLNLATVLIRA
jgi:hypothetical protein